MLIFAKAALRLRGVDVGDPRLPLPPATEEQVAAIADDLAEAGVPLARAHDVAGGVVDGGTPGLLGAPAGPGRRSRVGSHGVVTRPPARSDRSRGDRRPRPPRRDAGRSVPAPPEEVNPAELPAAPPPALPAGGLRVVALGGIGEIGRNMTVFEHEGRLLIVDCGVLFPQEDSPGVDLILPDFRRSRSGSTTSTCSCSPTGTKTTSARCPGCCGCART